MTRSKLRRQIAFEAAQLMYRRQESEYFRAKHKAARRLHRGWLKPADLPSNAEIRDQIQMLARTYEGELRGERLQEMRLEALRLMRLLASFRPRLIGSVMTGHVRQGSDIDLHLFSDSLASVTAALDREGMIYDVEHKLVKKHGEQQTYRHIHIRDRFPVELTVYPADKVHFVFKSSVTGKAMERATSAELEQLLQREYPDLVLHEELQRLEDRVDRFQVYESLLWPLEKVKEDPRYHPEADVLYHSLQVFELARNELPYDEEFLLAALLHDVGKGMAGEGGPQEHVHLGLEALEGFISPRTAWLIQHHMLAHQIADGTIGARAKRRLQLHESFDELILLCRCDREGRQPGAEVPAVGEVLDYLRDLERMCGG